MRGAVDPEHRPEHGYELSSVIVETGSRYTIAATTDAGLVAALVRADMERRA